jgi:sugar-specific transcriptional regulator TrmB
MILESIYKTLTDLGLSPTEAQIYVFLAQQGPKNREQIEAQLNLGNKESATSLILLRNKGFVEVRTDRSTIFSIIPFDVVLQRQIDSKKEQISLLKKENKIPL